ncbi:DegT/DnrJ/EryC1/StrS aminotransferase family protein [Histomonas meleagridis]|uniref:DegT/DnrJ/EryC1/StrS aminotransferase family protein n=1 Tax=Histomonas meleagridis TaxID=135588 RepID=UPI00355A78A8|nr:DegT/DnrJ/EryC1/StrS aminotransferase family protein [Histomonas meleagridis]KAH0802978.1 DegT/DnrJ/EryC1/StrS aminotransferase family protein [Histomonas meleagridis]
MFKFYNKKCNQNEIEEVIHVLNNGWVAPGKKAALLEKEVPLKCNKNHGILVNSKNSALFLACIAYGICEGEQVLIPSVSPQSFIGILSQLKATIKYYDINKETLMATPEEIQQYITPETKFVFISNPLSIPQDYSKLANVTIIEDLMYSTVKTTGSDASIITFDSICALALFNDPVIYNKALCIRDWGRVGTQDEDVTKRYDGWVLGNVRYDFKFVYGNLGFNFKSCEMSSALATIKMNSTSDEINDFDELKNQKNLFVSQNGYTLVLSANEEMRKMLQEKNLIFDTMETFGFAFCGCDEFANGKEAFENYVIINNCGNEENKKIVQTVLGVN